MTNLQKEISRTPPPSVATRIYVGGNPILYAYDCALLERETETGFVYTAVNLTTEKTAVLARRVNPLSPQGVDAMLERLRQSGIAGTGRLQADRPIKQQINIEKATEILQAVFTEILPERGYSVRAEQISLAEHILDNICRRMTTLAEAEVGTGKTLAYLVPAIIAKRGRLNDFWNSTLYPKMQCADMPHMPIVIATSSIALQRAILTEYIPTLSNILMESGVIITPLTAVIRKGKAHYVCERKLREYLPFESNRITKQSLEQLLLPNAEIDIAEIGGLTPYIKQKICVTGRCLETCPHKENCRFLTFCDSAESTSFDIQVCNHNYLLADTLLRAEDKRNLPYPLLKMERGTTNAIERFKKSGNGVLFASGSMWEGIDIPGDALSMLIIVRLPFAVPDPIGEYEQTQYESIREYIRCVVVPEMLIKLKQGFGRLIRTERDSGVVAILDCRANESGLYRADVANALPPCRVTFRISDVKQFLRLKKPPEYFMQQHITAPCFNLGQGVGTPNGGS